MSYCQQIRDGDCGDTFFGRTFLKPFCPVVKPVFRGLFRISVRNPENIPKRGPYIVASNHRSYLDPPVLNAVFPEPLVFIAKEELFRPPLGWILKHMRAIPIRRGAGDVSALERALDLLKEGCAVAVFPEGTRARPGEFLRPKAGVGLLAIKSGAPVVPVLIEGTDRVLPRGSLLPIPKVPIKVSVGKPLNFEGVPDSPKGYRDTALKIMEAIKSLQED